MGRVVMTTWAILALAVVGAAMADTPSTQPQVDAKKLEADVRLQIDKGIELLEANHWPDAHLSILPMLNPGGLTRNTRENEQGIDINRDYRHFRTPEAQVHADWLARQPGFDLTLLLHEDWESNGFYCYELNPGRHPSLAGSMIHAVSAVCPIDPTAVMNMCSAISSR